MGYAKAGDCVCVFRGTHKGIVGHVRSRAVGIRPFGTTMLTLFFNHPEHGDASVVVPAKDCRSIPVPNPGSDDAIDLGCLCPVLDNAHGRGWMCSGEYWINQKCPLHARKETSGQNQEAVLRDDPQQDDQRGSTGE